MPSAIDHEPGKKPAKWLLWIVIILLAAAFLRIYALSDVPPGFTHDEADHSLTARQIVDENLREIYFTVGYGREPLYDYSTAAVMFFLGSAVLASRLTSVYFSLFTVAALYAWAKRAFGNRVAILAAAGLAVGFWPVMTGRQALRSTTLPALFTLAVLLYWIGLHFVLNSPAGRMSGMKNGAFLTAGLVLGITFYTYMPARGLWLVFPLLLLYWMLSSRNLLQRMWRRTIMLLVTMVLVAAPLLNYLRQHPGAELRIRQLAQPLIRAVQGDFSQLLGHLSGGLATLFVSGDSAWRYNIAGKPLLGPLMATLFLAGLFLAIFVSLKRVKLQDGLDPPSAAFFSLAWLAAGLAPSLITGPELSITQGIGMQPVLYIFPALALVTAGRLPVAGTRLQDKRWVIGLVALFFGATALVTYRDYFQTWANQPEVRVQYETTMVAALGYLRESDAESAVISTVTPGRFHSPALAQMYASDDELDLHWFDARNSLLVPSDPQSKLLISSFAPLDPILMDYFAASEPAHILSLRDSDKDRPIVIYELDRQDWLDRWPPAESSLQVQFGDSVSLVGLDLPAQTLQPGDEIRLITRWQANKPADDLMIFVHLLGANDIPLAQADVLGVPSSGWQKDDQFLQLHRFEIPIETAPGKYPLSIGIYSQQDNRRLIVESGDAAVDSIKLATIIVES